MAEETATSQPAAPEAFEYRAEMKQLLHLIVHSLYTHPEVFLRELISNASDALSKARFRMLTDRDVVDPDAPLRIAIAADPEARTLTIEDTGIGMTRDDLIERIGTVASSGTLTFLQDLKASGKPLDAELIGQFGVGFYAAFMVAEEVVIETRHADPDSQGYRWRSDGTGTFTIEPIDRPARGTTITLHLKESAEEFSREARIREVVRKYSNFVDFPIALGGTQVNTVQALWRKQKDEVDDEERQAFYQFISNDPQEPLAHLHLHIEGLVSFRALLFVPATAPPGLYRDDYQRRLHLYVAGVFIQDDAEALLPDYLRFVRGVVDAEEVPLNVSREVTQSSPVLRKINQILTSKTLGLLADLASDAPDAYAAFFDQYGPLFKLGINADPGNQDKILQLLRYASTKVEPGEQTSLQAYVDRMPEHQEAIYYVLGDHPEVVRRHPNLEYFRKHDLEVLLLTDPVDVFTVPSLAEYGGHPIQSIERADLPLEGPEEDAGDAGADAPDLDALIARAKEVLGDRVEEVRPSKRLVDSAATLVAGAQGLDAQTERMMRMMSQGAPVPPRSKVLELNPTHPLVRNLARLHDAGDDRELVDKTVLTLFEGALLLEGVLDEPAAFMERLTALMTAATDG